MQSFEGFASDMLGFFVDVSVLKDWHSVCNPTGSSNSINSRLSQAKQEKV